MIDDEFDDIFNMMNRIFGKSPFGNSGNSPIHDRKYERLMDDDNIYYTFEIPSVHKEDIDIKSYENELIVNLIRDGKTYKHNLDLPYPIIPDKTKVTFKNGILDITVKINKDKAKRIEIEE